jgi:hypothetical protein
MHVELRGERVFGRSRREDEPDFRGFATHSHDTLSCLDRQRHAEFLFHYDDSLNYDIRWDHR